MAGVVVVDDGGELRHLVAWWYSGLPVNFPDRRDLHSGQGAMTAKPPKAKATPKPKVQEPLTREQTQLGKPIPALDRVKLMSPDEWEDFIWEWVDSLRPKYYDVQQRSGPGDSGLDIVGYTADPTTDCDWDNYQCKHYKDPLTPGAIWIELGKLCHYTFIGDYSTPRAYYFVAPQGVGTTLSKLLGNPEELRKKLVENWSEHCETKITSTKSIPLTGAFRDYVEKFDFSICKPTSILTIIKEHRTTPWHAARFGGGLPARPPSAAPPGVIAPLEARYVQQLFEA
jgi:hypothetical protein